MAAKKFPFAEQKSVPWQPLLGGPFYRTRPKATAGLAAIGVAVQGYNTACHLVQFRVREISERFLIEIEFMQFFHKIENLLSLMNCIRC